MIKIVKYSILIVIFVFGGLASKVWSQNTNSKWDLISYSGIVKDSIGNPIKNAKLFGNQGAVKTSTNSDGLFTMKVNLYSDILIEADGFNSSTVKVLNKTLNIVLSESPFLLGSKDAISMGFKNTKKGLSVGNVEKLNSDDILKNNNLTSFQEMLDTYGAGSKGGANLLGIGDALIIVDGLPRNASNLIPEEIEDITILKDVNSAMLYGSEAKNGVILIKTKRGTPNKKLMKMSIEKGIKQPIGMPNYLNSKDYMTLYNEARTNDGKSIDYDPTEIAKYDGSNPYRYPDVNYYGSEYLKSMYNSTKIVGEFGGGSGIATYYTNASWEHQDVLYKANNGQNNGTDRLKVRGNVDVKINSHIKSYIDAAFVFDNSTGLRTNYFTMASTFHPNDYLPLIPISSFEDPTITDPLTHVYNDYILGGNTLISKNSYGKNVIGELNYSGYSKNYQSSIQFNTGIIYDLEQITKGLTFRANASFDNLGTYSEEIQNTYAIYEPILSPFTGKYSSYTTINKDTKSGVLTLNQGSMQKVFGINFVLDYDRTFNVDHHLSSSLVGYYTSAMIPGSNQIDKNAHLGLNVVYDYKKTYVIDFTGAMINSVKLAPGNRISFSPSLGISWILSNAGFWKTNDQINYLKFKASAGILQTDAAFGFNLYNEVYGAGGRFTTGTGQGSYFYDAKNVARIANPNLQMEKMKNLNIGFESALFKKSLYLKANYFITNYADIIVQRFNNYPSFYSTAIPYENYNETNYSGVDISLNYIKHWKNFSINGGLNVLYSTSEYVIRDEIHNNDYQYLVGQSTDAIWGLKSLGFFASDAEAIAANQKFGSIKRGDIKYADIDGNGIIDVNDRTVIGNSSPKLNVNFNVSFEYKGFSLFVSASSRFGYNWIMNSDYVWVDGNSKYSEIVLNRWTDATAATATYPRLTSETSDNNFQNSTFWLRKGNDLTLSRVQLNYSLPLKVINYLSISGLSIYMRGSNLMYFAEEAQLRQINPMLTSTRNFALGLKITY